MDERAEWWHLPSSLMAYSPSTSSPLPASQLLSTLGTTEEVGVKMEAEVGPDGEKEGER